uniref:Uncharacterized protein n=1 Tax=Arundo donax TaxID=35708 RepID=A0A0A8ZI58_ARUDO
MYREKMFLDFLPWKPYTMLRIALELDMPH